MAPSASTGETLLDRSQRILGIHLDDDEVDKPKTRVGRSSPNRRKGQVGQAQRVHRQRTQRYILELENEVLKLRKSEAEARTELQKLRKQLEEHTARSVSGEPVPNKIAHSTATFDDPNLSDFANLNFSNDPIMIDVTGVETATSMFGCAIQASQREPPDIDSSMLSAWSPSYMGSVSTRSETSEAPTAFSPTVDMDMARLDGQAGIDFILKLESPCIPHVKFSLENDTDLMPPDVLAHGGPGHVFTATAALLRASQAPNPTKNPFPMPQNEIDKLLDASRRLKLENEMTPVQVWEKVKAQSKTYPITNALLNGLTADCGRFTFCNSFGTVIDKAHVDFIFEYYFGPM